MLSAAQRLCNANVALRADSNNFAVASLKEPFWWNSRPRYQKELTCSTGKLMKVRGSFSIDLLPKTTTLVLSTFTVNPLVAQNAQSRSNSLCSPHWVVDIRVKSSAYSRRGT